MHTTKVIVSDGSAFGKPVSFHHNGDLSGDCLIVVHGAPGDAVNTDREFMVPCEALLKFAAEMVRDRRIARLEQQDWRELI